MDGHLVKSDGTVIQQPGRDTVSQAVEARDVLWLDLCDSGSDTIAVLRDVFGFHPLAIEDAQHFGQRPKIEEYDDFTYLVAYGAPDKDGNPPEVHCFYSPHYLVTVHHGHLPAINAGCDAIQRHHAAPPSALTALYHVLDAITDSLFPYLNTFDDRIDELQDQIFVRPTDSQLAEMFALKRELVQVRRLVTPQRDMLSSLVAGTIELPGMTTEMERYFRDIYDHLIRVSDLVDSYRDLLSGSMDAYLSTVSNRLNVVMKQLTIIATVFLPLSFLTGFFGQNFGWMVQRLGSLTVFLALGLGSEVVAVVLLFWLFRKRGWLGDKALCRAGPGVGDDLVTGDVAEPQPVLTPLTAAAIFLVLTISPGGEAACRDVLADWAALERSVGFRAAVGARLGLACVAGIGSQAWDRLFAGPRPAELHPFRPLAGARHQAPATAGDLLFHIRADRMDLCFEFAAQVMDRLAGAVTVADEVHGFRFFDQRDLLGFVDGTENPGGRAALAAALVGDDDPDFAGGSYVIVQKYLHDMASWNALTTEQQEKVIGRTKLSDIELPDAGKPADSHVALNTITDPDGTERQIVRDNMPFGSVGAGEFGTYFIGYAATPSVTERMLANMFLGDPPGNHDRVLDFSTAVTGGLFFAPPADFLDDLPGPPDGSGSLGIGSLRGA